MSALENAALRRKLGDGKGARPPLRDPDYACEMFARIFEERLRATMRKPITVEISNNRVQKYGEIVRNLESGVLLSTAVLNEKNFAGLMPLAPPFIFKLVEVLSGLEPNEDAEPTRSLTSIDEALSEDFVDDVFMCFEAAIAPPRGNLPKGTLRFDRFLRDPSSIMDVDDDMDVFTIEFSLKIGAEGAATPLVFHILLSCLDYYKAAELAARQAAKRIAASAAKKDSAPSSLWSRAMLRALNEAKFPVAAVLAEFQVGLDEVAEFKPGHMLELPFSDHMSADLRFTDEGDLREAATICSGAIGAHGDHRAIKMTDEPGEAFLEMLSEFKF